MNILKFGFVVLLLLGSSLTYSKTTFVVTADLHYGFENGETSNRGLIQAVYDLSQKNHLETVDDSFDGPDFILIAGDLTHRSDNPDTIAKELALFSADWGIKSSTTGDWDVYACMGNHDCDNDNISGNLISSFMNDCYGDIHYSFDTEDIHVVCLGIAAKSDIEWLNSDLKKIENDDQPIVICQHFSPDAGEMRELKEFYLEAIADYNVVAIFCGHLHKSEHYVLQDTNHGKDYDVFLVDSPTRHSPPNSFYFVTINDYTANVFEYDWSEKADFVNRYKLNMEHNICDNKVLMMFTIAISTLGVFTILFFRFIKP